jgi:hypothetical protein
MPCLTVVPFGLDTRGPLHRGFASSGLRPAAALLVALARARLHAKPRSVPRLDAPKPSKKADKIRRPLRGTLRSNNFIAFWTYGKELERAAAVSFRSLSSPYTPYD